MGDAENLTEPQREAERDAPVHVPVLLQQALFFLQPQSGGVYVDATVGGGGHAQAILSGSAPNGRLVGVDRDPAALEAARRRLAPFADRATLRRGSFAHLTSLVEPFAPVDGVLFDLGFSSLQLTDPERGFSFQGDGPLDMRFDPQEGGPTAAELVNRLSVEELVQLLYRYGQEPQAGRIARAIVAARPLSTTRELAEVVQQAVTRPPRRSAARLHPATLTFQALRIAVNGELEALEAALPQALELLKPGGRLAVISFHSLEDRIVKQFLQREARDCVCPAQLPVCTCGHRARLRILTRRPERPCPAEVAANPRARPARLRAAERK